MPSTIFEFDSQRGYTLSGRLEVPEGYCRGWAVLAHCFTCGKDNMAAVRIARTLAQHAVGTLRFDFSGLGSSEGHFGEEGLPSDTRDLVAAVQALTNAGMAPSLLIGHSLGGAAALAAARDMPTIWAVVTIGAPFEISHALRQFEAGSLDKISGMGKTEVSIGGRSFLVAKAFVDDLARYNLAPRIAAMHRPLLILHAPHDLTVGIENASHIFQAAHHPKSFVALDGVDHLLTGPGDAEYAATLIASWASHYFLTPTADELRAEQPDLVIATETGASTYQLEIQAGGIRFLADEPASVGGRASGPTPYNLVAAGLAACTTMTLRSYANHKKISVTRIRTTVGHSKAIDGSLSDIFSRVITFEGLLNDEQRLRLLEIAERCPVDLTLRRVSQVPTTLNKNSPIASSNAVHGEAMVAAVTGR